VLTDAEDKGVVYDKALALRLDDIEVMALRVRSWVADQEVERRVLTGVGERQTYCERMRVIFDRVLRYVSRNSGSEADENLPSILSCPRRS